MNLHYNSKSSFYLQKWLSTNYFKSYSTAILTAILFVFAGFSGFGQETCSQTFSVSGQDDGPTVLTINSSDITCNGSLAIQSLTLDNSSGSLTNFNCDNWYDFTLEYSEAAPTVTGCGGDLNGVVITGFTQLTITSADLDDWSDGVTISIDVVVEHDSPTCLTPQNLTASNLTTTSADLDWDAEITATTGYDYFVTSDGTVPDASTTPTGSVASGTTTASLSSLTANTEYEVYVRSDCSSGDLSSWSNSAAFFKTECGVFNVPFTENFDASSSGSTTNPNAPDCWSFINTGAGWTYVINSSFNSQSGSQSYRLYNGSDISGDYMLVSPEIAELTTEGVQLSFSVKGASGQNIEIGTITDPTDASTFTALSTETLTSSNYEDIEVNIFQSTDSYVALRHGQDGTNDSFYIDDVSFLVIPDCLPPNNITNIDVTVTSLEFEWDLNPQADNGYLWAIYVEGEGPADDDTPVEFDTTFGAQNSIEITGLDPNTTYDFYVLSNCTGFGFGDPSEPLSVTTSCSAPTNITAESTYGLAAEFNWDSASSAVDGYEWAVYIQGEGPGDTAIDDGSVVAGTTGFDIDTLDADSDYSFYIRSSCGSGFFSDWSAAVDFSTGAACPNAEGLAVTNITATSADLEWNQSPNPTANDHFWKIVESGGNPSLPADVIDEGIVAYGNPMTASTSLLDSNTAYDFYVRIACASGGFSIGNGTPVSFTTLCEAVSSFPYTQDFDGTWSGSPAAPDCWAVVNNDGGSTWTRASTYITPRSGSWTAHGMGNQDDYLITPAFEIPAGENYEIFWYDIVESSTRNNTYDVLVSTTNTDITSFTDNLGTFDTTNTTWQERNLNLSAYAGQTIYIAFHQTYSDSSSWGFGLDDFSISEIPSCVTPENLAVSNITATSAEIDWDAETTATGGYDYFVTSDGTLPDGSTTPTGSVDSGTLTVNLTSLTADTDYDVYVRSDCGGENSDWSNAVSFSTPLLEASPWTEDFDVAGQDGWDLTGWTRGNVGSDAFTDRNVVGRDDSDVLYRNLWGTGASQTGSFETVSVGLVQAGDYLSYEYKISNFASPFGAPDPGSCEFTVSITGSDTGVVEVQDFTNDGKLGWHKKYFDLSAFEGEEVVVSVSAQRISGDFYLFFDNFAIKNINNYVYVDDATGWVGDPFSGGPPGPFAEIAEGSTSFEGFENLSELVVFAQANLDIEGVLDLSGDLYTDGEVTFKSTATKTGQLSPMISGDLIGEVTVERYIQAGDANNRAFRFVTSAVDAGSIYNNWQEGGNSPSGFGTHITGSDTGANGFDQTSTGNPSMFSFNNAAASQAGGAAWTEMPNTDATNLEAGMPYRLFVRGDRNIDLSSNDPTPNNTVLRAKGSLKIGTVPAVDLATGDGQFSFIGNPYQAIVNINGVTISGDVNDNYIYAWDSNAGDNGAYVTVELPAGTNPASNPNVNNLLQPGQAVFIRNNTVVTTAGSIDFTEFSKSVLASQLSPFSDEALTKVDFQLFTTAAFVDNSNPSDAVGLRFDENYSIDVNDADAGKLGNSGENLAIVQDNQVLSIEQRTFPVGEESIQLFVNNYQHEDYVFKAIAQNLPEGKAVFVKDNYLDTVTEMNIENGYAFSIDPSIPESTSIFRFELVFENETLGINNYLSDAVSLYPVPVEDILYIANSLNADLSLEVYNMLGQQVAKRNLAAGQDQNISMQGLESGVYIVKISDGEAVYNQQIIKK